MNNFLPLIKHPYILCTENHIKSGYNEHFEISSYVRSDFYLKFGAEYRHLHNAKKGKNSPKNEGNSQFQ